MASHALAEYRFRLNRWLVLYFALGIMISIRLGSVGIVRLMSGLGLTNTLWALLIVYTAAGLPLTIFVMTQFMRQIPTELNKRRGSTAQTNIRCSGWCSHWSDRLSPQSRCSS